MYDARFSGPATTSFFLYWSGHHRDLHSFPTRRSSDLGEASPARGAHPRQRGDDREIAAVDGVRSEEHTSELQSHSDLVCRLLLEKKNIETQWKYQLTRLADCAVKGTTYSPIRDSRDPP